MDSKIETEVDETKPLPENKGNWGYVVMLGTVITFVAGIGHINSFGLIYNEFIYETKSTAKSLTTAHGVFSMMLAIGGLILNSISRKITLRLGGLIGAIIFCIGSAATIFLTNLNQLPFTFGVLQGTGFGMMVPVCYSTINYYFIKKRTMIMSAIKAIQGIILMWYPQLIKIMMTEYGLKGTLSIISAISLHVFPGMVVMKTLDRGNTFKKEKSKAENEIENGKAKRIEENINLLTHKTHNEDIKTREKKRRRFQFIDDILMMKFLKDPIYLNICLGQSFVNFSDLSFFILYPMLLFQYGYDKDQVATCISIGAAADLAGRFTVTIISSVTSINTRLLFYTASLLTFIIRIVLLQVRDFLWMAVVIASLGVLRAWLHIASPLVISNYVTHQDFPGAYSLFMLGGGLVNVVFSPFIGTLKDTYEDYTPAFYFLTVFCLPCVIFWPAELILKRQPMS